MEARAIQIDLYAPEVDPRLPALRSLIYTAMTDSGLLPFWNEYYTGYANLPRWLKKKKAPSIFINEKQVWKAIHPGDPLIEKEKLIKAVTKASISSGKWRLKIFLRANLTFLLALVIAFFPKCPFCWAAYLSTLGLYQFSAITYQPWMLPVFIIFLFLNIFSLYLTRKRHHAGPLVLSLLGSLVIVLNRFNYQEISLIYVGSGLMLTGALWNSLRKSMVISLKNYFHTIIKGLVNWVALPRK